MEQQIHLKPQRLTGELLQRLEAAGLILTLRPPAVVAERPETDIDEALYESDPKFGGHLLLCVRKNATQITLYAHSDNEEVIFLKPPEKRFKPLYLIIGLHHEREFAEKAKAGTLSSNDVLALEVEYNLPETCMFTVLKGTPHCEITVAGGGEAPVFYVTEPAEIDMYEVDVAGTAFTLAAS